jgi:DNA-binding SARP family transcriptional activator/membrane-associated phospholipid phosphatase
MLRLQLLGGFRAQAQDTDVSALAKQPRRAALLTFLAVERDASRERVMALLWPEAAPERGRHSLNQGIYYLRRLIGSDWVELQGDRVVVASWVTTDVQELERAAAADAHDVVLRLYGGPLLAGTGISATADFGIWADARSASIDRMHRRSRRETLSSLLAAGRTTEALHCAEEWCRLDPMEDEAQHRFIELLATTGQRTEALRQYGSYRRLLEEHELRPLDETLKLVEHLQQGDGSRLPAMAADAVRIPAPAAATSPPGPVQAVTRPLPQDGRITRGAERAPLLNTRRGLLALLGAVFVFNWVQTSVETWLAPRLPVVAELRMQFARASHWFEGHHAFEYHELTNRLAVVGYSAAYFFLLPLLLVAVGAACYRRPGIRPFRTFSLAVTLDYLISLPFFLFMPVPERWTYPESGAMVLSDMWASRLIDLFRPISALDNSFPSFHVSLTVLLVLTSFLFALRFRWSVLFLGIPVALATLVLGIHWMTDVIAGAAVGVLSVALARRIDRALPDSPAVTQPLNRVRTQPVPVHAFTGSQS